MRYHIVLLSIMTVLLTGCFGGAARPTATAPPPEDPAALVEGAQTARGPAGGTQTPQSASAQTANTIATPETFLKAYKTYVFNNTGDLDFNERWFFLVKSGGESADPQNYTGQVCIEPGQTLSVITAWGEKTDGVWNAFEGGAWKVVDGMPGRGVGASASKLREAAAAGGLETAVVMGNFGEEQVFTGQIKSEIPGVDAKYWTSLYACNCAQQIDLWITNPLKTAACINWKVQNDQAILWVQAK